MDEQKKIKVAPRKKSHYFETYISKLLLQIAPHKGITSNAKQQINSFICILLKTFASIIFDLIFIAKKKTISVKEVENSLKIILFGDLLNCCIKEGKNACDNYANDEFKGSRQNRAKIIFPPSIIEKFLRNFGYSKIMVSNYAPVYLASVLEYITFEILDMSVPFCTDGKRARLTVRDMELAVRNDIELNVLFNKLGISFLGGGVIPFIHSSLLIKKKMVKNDKKNNTQPTHKFRYGTLALKTIKKQQKLSDSLILAKSPFEKMVRHCLKTNLNESIESVDIVKVSKDVFLVLQYFIEQYIIDVLTNANYLTIHAGRVKLLPIDIQLYVSFKRQNIYHVCFNNPYKNVIDDDNMNLLSIENDE